MLHGIEIDNFRCIEHSKLDFDPRGTGVLGPNASGKTSLLEAIFFLGHGRSFRGSTRERLLRRQADAFRLIGTVTSGEHGREVIGLEYKDGELRARLGGRDATGVSEIAEHLPIQIIDPGVHRLIEEGSSRRRRMLDWGVFHVEHTFVALWRRYQRGLQQRNAALRAGSDPKLVFAWDQEMATAGAAIDTQRRSYFSQLQPLFEGVAGELLGADANLEYRRGWPPDIDLSTALAQSIDRDARVHTTTVGPHRADLVFRVGDVLARDRVSRGQQKMLASALILAQIELRARSHAEPTCLLLDDPAAELDVDNLGKLLAAIAQMPAQLVVTSVTPAGLRDMNIGRMFHVERGCFTPML